MRINTGLNVTVRGMDQANADYVKKTLKELVKSGHRCWLIDGFANFSKGYVSRLMGSFEHARGASFLSAALIDHATGGRFSVLESHPEACEFIMNLLERRKEVQIEVPPYEKHPMSTQLRANKVEFVRPSE